MWFQLTPLPADWADTARFKYRNEAILPAPPERVFDVLVQVDPWKDWFPDALGGRYTSSPPWGPGTTRELQLKTMSVEERFLVYEPGRRWTFYLEKITLPLVTAFLEDYQLSPHGDGETKLVWIVAYQPRMVLRPLHPLIRPIYQRMFEQAIGNLRDYLKNNPLR